MFGTVQRISPAEKVLELRTPYGHDMLITSGVDLSTAGIKVGEQVTVDLLDGLVVDLRKSSRKALTFAREDVILSEQFGPVRQGAKVAMTSGTSEVVKVLENAMSKAFIVTSEEFITLMLIATPMGAG